MSVLMASSAVSLSTLSTSRQQLDASQAAERERSRHAQVEQRLRREPFACRAARAARAVWLAAAVDQRRRRPGLAAEMLQVGRDHDAGARHVD